MEPKEKIVKTTFWGTVLNDPSLLLTIGYLLLIFVGMVFSYKHFNRWGIDIFEYAGFSDFIIAPFRDVLVPAFVIFSVVITILFFYGSQKLDSRFPELSRYWNFGIRQGSKAYKLYYQISLIPLPVFYIFFFAQILAEVRFKRMHKYPESYRCEVFVNNSWQSYLKIGQTENYSMLYDEASKKVLVLRIGEGVSAFRNSVPATR